MLIEARCMLMVQGALKGAAGQCPGLRLLRLWLQYRSAIHCLHSLHLYIVLAADANDSRLFWLAALCENSLILLSH